MTPEEQTQMQKLCQRIAVEKDHATFTKLITELNELFSHKDQRLEERDRKNRQSEK